MVNKRRRVRMSEDDEYAFAVAVRRRNAVTTVHVAGEIDSFTGGDLEAVIHEQLAFRPSRLIVDLSRVVVLGSTGLAFLGWTREVCRERGIELELAGSGREDLVRQLTITGLEWLLAAGPSGVAQACGDPYPSLRCADSPTSRR
ncbi:Sulfate transporter/antisigma-factor antagonist STAS [Pseudonocardia dioxanivorans CB1190]|jgi:anti-anti-sigma factor|uniref:Sulfate transporter/antisigma-factor antagonist STAS n=1 Tax=Pseudonocardia dioxanivorans (strain ATCC 55486 / DSM 44775 / JCM 13855 / CB1190) TaxID=675635 RepID=F4CZD8_PSEUX|nr:STAS domain-containing protein [Pseudonocardia dioxanivorans]AEA25669.1 Sulfate transporter/antisigma-factor antagonist STAS [Pseudonocardia dioxanivorans CB1190]